MHVNVRLPAAAVLLVCSLGSGQWLETQIDLANTAAPAALCYNSANNKVYCANNGTDDVTIIDGVSNDIITDLATGDQPYALCYNSTDNTIYCLNTGTAQSISVIDGTSDIVVAFIAVGPYAQKLCYNSRDNRVYCSNMYGNNVTVIDGATNSVVDTVPVGSSPSALYYYPHTNKVYCANTVGFSVTVIDGASNEVLATLPADAPAAFGTNPDNDKVYCVSTNRQRMYVFDGTTNQVLDSVMLGTQATPVDVAYCPQNGKAYLANKNGTMSSVFVVDGATNQVLDSIAVEPLPEEIIYNRLNNKVYTSNTGGDNVSVIDCATNQVTKTIPIDTGPSHMALNPRYNRVYVTCRQVVPSEKASICVIRDSGGGVEESFKPQATSPKLGPTVVRGVLSIGGSRQNTGHRAELLDIAGRNVLELHAGANDVSGLPPGVYFVRSEPSAVTKVIVQR